ncbi:Glycosyl hydrolase family protein with chitinase insertion domain, putative [Theobroma cacao]|uniref:Glycosyl hydrolase family protein with chitinase insertion domain, putative n=1 Tax=Theobroma cacao TaxID=3641 RepID=A0A061GR73_THECC|nr:Glycosyl hydrolase family protein with chitinase insertion domain, putative [Theobroma cacao]
MAKQKMASFVLAVVLILGANISFSAASFPTLLTRNYWQNSRPTKMIGWPPGADPENISPSPSPQPAPTPPPYSDDGIKGGYWPSWLAYSFPPSSIPTLYFTHVFYAFVGIDASTYNLSTTQPDDEWMGNFTATLHAKKPPAKALLSIGGANSGPGTFSGMASDPDNRAAFIKSTIATARKYGFDGLDIDWEFPSNPDDMSNLSVLFKEWRQAVKSEASDSGKPRLLLSAAVYFASSFLFDLPRTYPGDAIAKYVDFVNPMCFDYHGSWDTSVTGEHALLYDKSSNISTSYGISSWIEIGVPSKKLVMGMPLYGRTWELEDPKKHKIGDPAIGVGPGDNGILLYKDIVTYNADHHAHTVYDGDTVSEYSYSGTDWIGYDGPTSVAKKVEYAKAHNLGGYFFWALGYDTNWTLSAAASNAWEGIY